MKATYLTCPDCGRVLETSQSKMRGCPVHGPVPEENAIITDSPNDSRGEEPE